MTFSYFKTSLFGTPNCFEVKLIFQRSEKFTFDSVTQGLNIGPTHIEKSGSATLKSISRMICTCYLFLQKSG